MLVTELSFPHLQAEREVRLTRELERQRVVAERVAPDAQQRRTAWRRPTLPTWLRMPRRDRRAIDPCPTCPSAA